MSWVSPGATMNAQQESSQSNASQMSEQENTEYRSTIFTKAGTQVENVTLSLLLELGNIEMFQRKTNALASPHFQGETLGTVLSGMRTIYLSTWSLFKSEQVDHIIRMNYKWDHPKIETI